MTRRSHPDARRGPARAGLLAAALLFAGAALSNTGCAGGGALERGFGMITIRNEIVIHRPVEEVFDYVANFENMPRWNYYVRSVVRTTPGVSGLGASFHQVRQSDAQDYRIVAYDPPRVVAMTTLPPERPLTMRFSLVPTAGGTRLVDEWTLAAGAAAPFVWLGQGRIRDAVAANLRCLRELLETGTARLPDGRASVR